MKTQEDIQKRLDKLYSRYLQRYVAISQLRKQCSCKWYTEANSLNRVDDIPPMEYDIAPCKSSTLLIVQTDLPVGVCTFGSDKPLEWNGDLCDDEYIMKSCKNFSPRISINEATEEFNNLMCDDEYVIENYKDIAALQWVLCTRVKTRRFSGFERLLLLLFSPISFTLSSGRKRLPPIKESIW
jgi:hypothetical protein